MQKTNCPTQGATASSAGNRTLQTPLSSYLKMGGWFLPSFFPYPVPTATAKSLQSCPTVRPHRRQPTRLPRPWDSPGKNTGLGCHFLLQCMKVKSESEVAESCPTLSDPMDCGPPGSSVHGIFQARVLEWGAIAFSDPAPNRLPNFFPLPTHPSSASTLCNITSP